MTETAIPKELQQQVDQAAALQQDVEARVKALKTDQERIDATWAQVKDVMVANNIKSVKGPWGSITIAERKVFKATDLKDVPAKFIKKVLDTTKVGSTFTLEGKLPKGVEMSITQYLTKRIK
jgi:hypothetical protein